MHPTRCRRAGGHIGCRTQGLVHCVAFTSLSFQVTALSFWIALRLSSLAIILRIVSCTLSFNLIQLVDRSQKERATHVCSRPQERQLRNELERSHASPSLPLTTHYRTPSPFPATACTCLESLVLIIRPSSLVHPARWNSIRIIH
jgi:hypothetical protein